MQQFMLFYSFLWCLLKISKLCHTDFFSLCISLLADTVWIKSLTKRGGSEPACLLKLLETFLIFQEATEDAGASVVHRFNIQSYLGRRLVWFCSNVSSFAILFPPYQAWKWLEIQKRVVCLMGVLSRRVCALCLHSGEGMAGYASFFTAVFAQVGNNSVILVQQTQWYTCMGASIEHSESCNMQVSPL